LYLQQNAGPNGNVYIGRHYPACWTADQWTKFKVDYGWLYASNGKLGCDVCRSVMALGPNRSLGMRVQLSKEWSCGLIQPYGETRAKLVLSLRKKIYEHRDSASHKAAESVQKTASSETLKTVVTEQQTEHVESTCKVFRTVYYLAQNNRPFLDHQGLVQLQILNGAQLGRMLHSNVVATDIADHIANEMRRRLLREVVDKKNCRLQF